MLSRLKRRSVNWLSRRLRAAGASADESALWRRLARNTAIGYGGMVAAVLLGVGRTALLTKSMAIDDYGRVFIVLSLFGFLGVFIGVRIHDLLYSLVPQFEADDDAAAIKGLVILTAALSLAVGLIIGCGVFAAAPWIASVLYDDAGLAWPFRVYAITVILSSVSGVFPPILRLADRFAVIVMAGLVRSLLTLGLLAGYFASADSYSIAWVVGILGCGILAESVLISIAARRHIWRYWTAGAGSSAAAALLKYRSEVVSLVIHTNLAGYLRLPFGAGGPFLLGVFGTPQQVAIYNLANGLVLPLRNLANSIGTALFPEVTTLWAQRRLSALMRSLHAYVPLTTVVAVIGIIPAWLLARPVILLVSTPEYLDTQPVLIILTAVAGLNLMVLPLYPVGLRLGMLKWANMTNAVNTGGLACAVFVLQPFTALKMAIALLIATLLLRAFFYLPVYRRFVAHTRAAQSEAAETRSE